MVCRIIFIIPHIIYDCPIAPCCTRIVDVVPTVLPVLDVKENRTDYIFILENNTYLHLEFQTTVSMENLYRFALYDARIINKDKLDVNTAVIYSGKIETAPEGFRKGSLSYNVTNVYMKGFNGDKEYKKLQKKILKSKPLDDIDLLKLIFLPLMKSEISENEMAIKAAELAKNILGDVKTFVIGAIIAITDKFMSEDYRKKLLEVLKMTHIEQMIREKGREEGLEEGREEGREEGENNKAIEIAKVAIKEGFNVDIVVKLTGLTKEVVLQLQK